METPLPEFFIIHPLAHITGKSNYFSSINDNKLGTACTRKPRGVENDKELKETGAAQRDNDEARKDWGSHRNCHAE